MTVSRGLVRASKIMAWLSAAAVFIVPAGTAFEFVSPHLARIVGFNFDHHGLGHLTNAVPFTDRMFALLCTLVPVAIAIWGFLALARLFRCFAAGEIFSADALRALSRVTAALFWYVLAEFLMEVPISYFLTAHTGHHDLSLTLGSEDVTTLFVAGVAFVIARVMAEARRVADENAAFV